ncbi:ferritin-like protein [Ceratobasidium sp. AG-Ba]|nr:ferritin-like protein [Ceratobasidium sp. AG-Ba]QRW07463.1 ferritin-like protein [Ceratobasidium sp. AG-Ba]
MSGLPKPAFPAPEGPPLQWDIDAFREHAQTAVILELHTIPLYLFSQFCIKPVSGDAAGKIAGVVVQEMLHLALAGNILCSLGGQPVLYGSKYTPQYPCEIFYENVELHLQPPSPPVIDEFIRVEAPSASGPVQPPQPSEDHVLPKYHTIGEFYKTLIAAMQNYDKEHPGKLFDPSTANRQFNQDDSVSIDGMNPITDIASAVTAMTLIIDQGEGGGSVTESHWATFNELKNQTIEYYEVVSDPHTSDSRYEGLPIKTAMLALDAAYCYLLLSIESTWVPSNHRDKLVGNIHKLMGPIIAKIATFLVTQTLAGTSEHAPPPFNYFPFSSTEAAYQELKDAVGEASNNYQELKGLPDKVDKLFDLSTLHT